MSRWLPTAALLAALLLPALTGCGLLGPVLSLLLSGPGNPYSLSIAPRA